MVSGELFGILNALGDFFGNWEPRGVSWENLGVIWGLFYGELLSLSELDL